MIDGERVFEFVRRFAQFAKAASGRVSFQSVHDAADVTHVFRIFGVLLKLQRVIVQ
jgi:hypothetical protein